MAGQTLSQVRALLDEAGLAPRHRYGQNFLIDLNLMRKLPALAGVQPGDVVLEVGPGTGSLTELLLDAGARVVAVEIDFGLAGLLQQRLGGHPDFTLVVGDALDGKHALNPTMLEALAARQRQSPAALRLAANLPYQIATPLLIELLLCADPRFDRLVCTIQREVGERFCAEPRRADYGPVSVVGQSLARVHVEATLPAAAFWPRPKVESAFVTFAPLSPDERDVRNPRDFASFVRLHFQQRRKTLRGAARSGPDADALPIACDRLGISTTARPEELSPAQWRALYRACRP
ncbi:MAG: ribosomal RNA small subunit methyltransferase A [Planctomycetia bacterium]|nr:MAG: ribosomal RNA small subunit methyltransferase A [Planctomycetia bacterium]